MKGLLINKPIMLSLLGVTALYIAALYVGVSEPASTLLPFLRYGCVLLCALIVLLSIRHPYGSKDIRYLLIAFCFTLAADVAFLFLESFELGITIFMFAHLFYIRRYKKRDFIPCLIAIVAMLSVTSICGLLGIRFPYIMPIGGLYAILLFLNTIFVFHSSFSRPNKTLASTGMIFFILCDFNAATGYLLAESGQSAFLADYLMWLFYVPAITLLALSGYCYATLPCKAAQEIQNSKI